MNRDSLILNLIALAAGGAFTASLIGINPTQAQSSMPMGHQSPHSQPMMDHSSMGMMQMDLGPADGQLDLRFIDGMIPHHQGAVVMAKEALQKSKRPEIQKLAKEIIAAQEAEIKQMQAWRKQWYAQAPAEPQMWDGKMGHMMAMSPQMMSSMMMNQPLGSADDQFDLRFLNAMIPHHEGALVMAQDVLKKSKRTEIQKLAQDILSSQQAEIDQMNAWRKTWYQQ